MNHETEFNILDLATKKAVNALAFRPSSLAFRYFLEVKPDFPFDTLEAEKESLFLQRFPVTDTSGRPPTMQVVYHVIEKNPMYPGDTHANRLIAFGNSGDRERIRKRFHTFVISAFSFLHTDAKDRPHGARPRNANPCSKRSGALPNIAKIRHGP